MKSNKLIPRLLCCLVALMLVLCTLVGCSSSGKTLMSIGKQKLTVNMYELLLSRMKGTLAYNDYPVDSDDFWNTITSAQGATHNDYFTLSIQEEAKMMLIKLYLFEEKYQLTLPDSYYEKIDEYIDDTLTYLHNGSKTEFNRVLSEYGVNMKMLRENYIIEDKIDYLKSHLSSLTSDTAREEYYQDNYVRFRQILLPLYQYLYETDEFGDTIYFKDEFSDRISDDTKGQTKVGTDGKTVTDKNGDVVYYTEDGHIAYNKKNGVIRGIDKDNDGYTDYEMLDEEGAKAIVKLANDLTELIVAGDFSTFEDYGADLCEQEIWNAYPNGMYINLEKNYPVAYIDDMQKELNTMKDGDVALIESDNAYHLIMKYPLDEGGYKNKENQDWFEEFEDEMITEVLNSMCQEYMDDVVVDKKVLATAKDMKTIGANKDY